MILVDTSIWIDHLRAGSPALAGLLEMGRGYCHPFVVGELACGSLGNRSEILNLLQSLPQLPTATNEETLFFIEQHKLMGRGIGYIDTHLLASTAIHAARLWTRDKRLKVIAEEMDLAFEPVTH
ncbi:type II toxin-antitoxin system VapC family toxin [Collimonas sp. NPDC087041]|uniref:type II toxin-antitoxin system VapC family toxin n=1 Tax=Collimonas sp. NPDC087041 TaxID=3363960 RepID=UPI00381664EE